jgi:hypothetical protein
VVRTVAQRRAAALVEMATATSHPLDELHARLRWRYLHGEFDEPDDRHAG